MTSSALFVSDALSQRSEREELARLCGGQPYAPQATSLKHGADIVVGTPGRIEDHLGKGSLQLVGEGVTGELPDEARDMIIRLSDFLRYSLKHREKKFVPLKEEIGRMKDYLSIEKIRFGDKLQYSFTMSGACEEFPVPTMIFQLVCKSRVLIALGPVQCTVSLIILPVQ